MACREAGEHQIVTVHKCQDVGVAGHGIDGVVFRLSVLAADGQVVYTCNDQPGAVIDVFPAVILLRAAAVVLGGAEIDGFLVNNDFRVGADGSKEFVGVGHRNRGFRAIGDGFGGDDTVHGVLGDRVALGIHRAAAVFEPAGNQAVFKGVAIHRHKVSKSTEGVGFHPVVPEDIVFQGHKVYAGASDKVLGLIAVDFAIGYGDIRAIVQTEHLAGFPLALAEVVNPAVNNIHAQAVHHQDAVVGTLVDITVGNGHAGTAIGTHARHAAAVQPHIPNGHGGTAIQIHNAAHTVAGFLRMSGGEARHGDILTAVQPQNLRIPGRGGNGHAVLPRAGDGQILRVLNHQFIAIKGFLPAAEFIARFPGVGAGSGQVVGARFQPNLPVGADGGNEIIHIGHGVHTLGFRCRRGFGRHCRGYDGSLPSDILRAGRHGQQHNQG